MLHTDDFRPATIELVCRYNDYRELRCHGYLPKPKGNGFVWVPAILIDGEMRYATDRIGYLDCVGEREQASEALAARAAAARRDQIRPAS
ncbi:hypothetical protein [Aldersonia kunmingensis]|uniref:hypothetical protein n=1 Tax=Aldersonia kunmingensis TaxID=408066 RepID=UPI00083232D8|nr:hypothetical protein [Aldersonia kunmingensis]